jgi:hypothetical protein
MIVYMVFRVGIYRHECGGIYTHKDRAIEVARVLIAAENDDHHHYEIVPFQFDTQPELVENRLHPHMPGFMEMDTVAYVQRYRDRVRVGEDYVNMRKLSNA